jgi:hypothetical protein
LEANLIKQNNSYRKDNASEKEGKPIKWNPRIFGIKFFPKWSVFFLQRSRHIISVVNHESSGPNGKQDY